jgi:hypothetical protein
VTFLWLPIPKKRTRNRIDTTQQKRIYFISQVFTLLTLHYKAWELPNAASQSLTTQELTDVLKILNREFRI